MIAQELRTTYDASRITNHGSRTMDHRQGAVDCNLWTVDYP